MFLFLESSGIRRQVRHLDWAWECWLLAPALLWVFCCVLPTPPLVTLVKLLHCSIPSFLFSFLPLPPPPVVWDRDSGNQFWSFWTELIKFVLISSCQFGFFCLESLDCLISAVLSCVFQVGVVSENYSNTQSAIPIQVTAIKSHELF